LTNNLKKNSQVCVGFLANPTPFEFINVYNYQNYILLGWKRKIVKLKGKTGFFFNNLFIKLKNFEGNFSCLEARFLMKRSIGYHLWQTYVPTATCLSQFSLYL